MTSEICGNCHAQMAYGNPHCPHCGWIRTPSTPEEIAAVTQAEKLVAVDRLSSASSIVFAFAIIFYLVAIGCLGFSLYLFFDSHTIHHGEPPEGLDVATIKLFLASGLSCLLSGAFLHSTSAICLGIRSLLKGSNL